jgi:hypothetical protein
MELSKKYNMILLDHYNTGYNICPLCGKLIIPHIDIQFKDEDNLIIFSSIINHGAYVIHEKCLLTKIRDGILEQTNFRQFKVINPCEFYEIKKEIFTR